jgi:hypothetical protein
MSSEGKREPPIAGLVVRFDYLWSSEAEVGKTEGGKELPCAVVLPLPVDKSGR